MFDMVQLNLNITHVRASTFISCKALKIGMHTVFTWLKAVATISYVLKLALFTIVYYTEAASIQLLFNSIELKEQASLKMLFTF